MILARIIRKFIRLSGKCLPPFRASEFNMKISGFHCPLYPARGYGCLRIIRAKTIGDAMGYKQCNHV